MVLRTALITFLSFVVLIALCYFSVAIFSPKSLKVFYSDLNDSKRAVKYAEKQYSKSEDLIDLYSLCVMLDEFSDSQKTEQYISDFVKSDNFNEFCNSIDNENTNTVISTSDYLYGKLVIATYINSGISDAIEVCIDSVKNGYSDFNAFNILITSELNLSESDKQSLIDTLVSLNVKNNEEVFLNRDISLINNN